VPRSAVTAEKLVLRAERSEGIVELARPSGNRRDCQENRALGKVHGGVVDEVHIFAPNTMLLKRQIRLEIITEMTPFTHFNVPNYISVKSCCAV